MDADVTGCDVCGGSHNTEDCPQLGLTEQSKKTHSRAYLTLPHFAQLVTFENESFGITVRDKLPARSKLGPFEAKKFAENFDVENGFLLKLFPRGDSSDTVVCLDTTSEFHWMCYIRTAATSSEQNCMAVQIGYEIYYTTTRDVLPGQELMVWYAPHYARKLGKSTEPDPQTQVLLGIELPFSLMEDCNKSDAGNSAAAAPDMSTQEIVTYQCCECSLHFDSIEAVQNHSHPKPVQADKIIRADSIVTKEGLDTRSHKAAAAPDTSTKETVTYQCCECSLHFDSIEAVKNHSHAKPVQADSDKIIRADNIVKKEVLDTRSHKAVASEGTSRGTFTSQCDEAGHFDRMQQPLSHKREQTTQPESDKNKPEANLNIPMRIVTDTDEQNNTDTYITKGTACVMDDVTNVKVPVSSISELNDGNLNGTIHSHADSTSGQTSRKHVSAPALNRVSYNCTQLTGRTEQQGNVGVVFDEELNKSTKDASMKEMVVTVRLQSTAENIIHHSRNSNSPSLKTSNLSNISVLPDSEKVISDYARDNLTVSSTSTRRRRLRGKRKAGDGDFIFPPLKSKQRIKPNRLLLAASTSKLSVGVPYLEKVIADNALREDAVRVAMSRGILTVSSLHVKKKKKKVPTATLR